LTPQEESDLLAKIWSGGLSGLGFIGETLGKGGAAVRGLASGAMGGPWGGGLLNLLPFSDTLGITAPEQKVSGQQLNEQLGLDLGDGIGGFAGGLATDILTDPLTYLTGGLAAVGKTGKVLKNAGMLRSPRYLETIPGLKAGSRMNRMTTTGADVLKAMAPDLVKEAGGATPELLAGAIRSGTSKSSGKLLDAAAKLGVDLTPEALSEPVGSLLRARIPFTDIGFNLGKATNPVAVGAAKGMDWLGHAARFGNIPGTSFSPGSAVAKMFDSKLRGADTELAQKMAPELFHRTSDAIAEARDVTQKLAQSINTPEIKAVLNIDDPQIMRRVVEGIDTANLPPEVTSMVQEARGKLAQVFGDEEARGLITHVLKDKEAQYWPRYLSEAMARTKAGKTAAFSAFDPSSLARQPELRDIKGGTAKLMEIAGDETLNKILDGGGTAEELVAALTKGYRQYIPPTYTVMEGGKEVAKDQLQAVANWLTGLPEETRKAMVYGNHPLADFQARLAHGLTGTNTADFVAEMLTRPDTKSGGYILAQPTGAAVEKGRKTLASVMDEVGIKGDAQDKFLSRVYQKFFDAGVMRPPELAKATVSEAIAKDIGRIMTPFKGPEAGHWLVRGLDWYNNLWKMGVTTHPAFQARNRLSGIVQNVLSGLSKPFDELWPFQSDAKRILTGGTVKAAEYPAAARIAASEAGVPLERVTDEMATAILRRQAYAYDLTGKYHGQGTGEVTGAASERTGAGLSDILNAPPGAVPWKGLYRTHADIIGDATWGDLNPLKTRGVGKNVTSEFVPAKINETVGWYVESMNRLQPWLSQLRRGVDFGEASRAVGEAQVQYGNRYWTKIEQGLAKVFPFFKFPVAQAKFLAKELAQKPGGGIATAIKETGRVRGKDNMPIPDYLSQTLSIPIPEGTPLIGPQAGGDPRYLTGFGTMHESPLDFLGGGLPGFLAKGISSMSAPLKAIPELASGMSYFQRKPGGGGRALKDLDPLLGRTIGNVMGSDQPVQTWQPLEYLLANSPASRVLTTIRQMTDPRKAATKGSPIPGPAAIIPQLSGVRMYDLPEKAQDAYLRELTNQAVGAMPGAREFTRFNIPAEKLAELPPEEQAQYQKYQAIQKMLEKKSKVRKKQREMEFLLP
jgi:hypothetical protein